MESHAQVPVASESTYKTNCSLRASAIRFWAPVASGLTPVEPPTMVQPLHRLGLGSLHRRRAGTGTSPAVHATPCVRLQELPRRTQGLAPVASESAYPRRRINPASALRTGQTHSDQHVSNRRRHACRATTGAPTSHRIERDRRVALVHRRQNRSTDHTATVTSCRARTCRLCQTETPRGKYMYRPRASLRL